MTALEQALSLWRRGLSVIPVPRPCSGAPAQGPGDGKTPIIPWKPYQDRRPTEDEIRTWFQHEQNIAIVTGRVSGVVVVDADSPEARRWITRHLHYTPWQTKTARGFHLFYRHPGGHVSNRAHVETSKGRLALDARGDGGYVVAPGSVHATGATYEFAGDWTIPRERLPRFWVGWLKRPSRPQVAPVGLRPTGDVVQRARRYLDAVPVPEIGQGSDHATLYAAARLARGFGLTEADATALLWDWAGGRAGWTHEWVARKVRNALQYCTEPMGALR